MGLCLSSGAAGEAAAAAPRDTALVLLPSGELREYPRPATAARVLEDASSGAGAGDGGWVLCDADLMGFEGPVAAVGAAEALRAGQIYFVLPAAARRRGLAREEVAALAVRASDALSRAATAATGRRSRGAVAPLVFAPPEEQEEQQEGAERTLSYSYKAAAAAPQRKRRPAAALPGRRLERFASDLTAIPECETASSD